MNTSLPLKLEPARLWQSTAEITDLFPGIGHRTTRPPRRSWQQRAGIMGIVLLLQVGLAVALIKGGIVSVPRLPDSITLVNLPAEELTVKAPPPTMPAIQQPLIPIETPVVFDVIPDNAITVPPTQPHAAPVASSGGGYSAVSNYQVAMLRHLASFKRYPAAARAQHRQGVATVRFTMDRSGRVLNAALVVSAKSDVLDREAVELMQRASPLPAPPPEVTGDPITLMVPVEFFLR